MKYPQNLLAVAPLVLVADVHLAILFDKEEVAYSNTGYSDTVLSQLVTVTLLILQFPNLKVKFSWLQ